MTLKGFFILIQAGVIWFLFFNPVKAERPVLELWPLPELVACSCDSAFRCLSDDDYMHLVVYEQQFKNLF